MVCGGGGGIYVICRGGRNVCGLELQVQPDRSSVRNIFENSFAEEGTEAGKDICEGGLKFAASEARKKFYRTYSVVKIEENRYVYPSTQEHHKLEGKLNFWVKRSMIRPGSDHQLVDLLTFNFG